MTESRDQGAFRDPEAELLSDDGNLALLIRLLKLGSFINTPMKEGVCEPHDIAQTELKVVMALAGEGALAGHDLVNIMGMAPMNVSRAIAGLRERGLIESVEDRDNRRRKPVRLSAAGEEFYKTFGPELQKLSDEVLGTLSARERASLTRMVDKVNAAMAGWITSHHQDVKLGR
ncbi:MarR family winged helix-turn-helix transcriptional regulator [Parerythrobacter aestuarii]|uniref:MarR family winged helix-turn-helix transcriptional regulator n=1 Tax=Parerythrobacter aestuarii TaxID=3020909 RepID=UPI0024DED76C|nr:MarR family transcriptional regulator [Parerythrobacter aestuarii]